MSDIGKLRVLRRSNHLAICRSERSWCDEEMRLVMRVMGVCEAITLLHAGAVHVTRAVASLHYMQRSATTFRRTGQG